MSVLRSSTIARYSLPLVGFACSFTLFKIYLLKFSTDVLLIAPALMGLVLGLSRLWDAASDGLAGYWSDRTRSRLGRRRPWIYASLPPLALASWAMWGPPSSLSGAPLAAWMAASVFLFFVGTTLFNVPHQALGSELSLRHHERTRVFRGRVLCDTAGGALAIGAIAWIERSGDASEAAVSVAAAAVAVTALLVFTCLPRVAERPAFRGRGAQRPLAALADVWHNPHARIVLCVGFLVEFAANTLAILLPYMTAYVWRAQGTTALYLASAGGGALVAMALALPLSRRVGKRNVWVLAGSLGAAGFAGIFAAGGAGALALASACVIGLAHGLVMVIGPSIKSDVIDYDEYLTGQRKEGSYFAAWSVATKGAIALSMAATGLVLQAAGFVPGATQSPDTLLTMQLFFASPALLFAASAFVAMRLRLGEREHARLRSAIDAREAGASSADSPSATASTRSGPGIVEAASSGHSALTGWLRMPPFRIAPASKPWGSRSRISPLGPEWWSPSPWSRPRGRKRRPTASSASSTDRGGCSPRR